MFDLITLYMHIIVKLDFLENEIYLLCTGTAVILREVTGWTQAANTWVLQLKSDSTETQPCTVTRLSMSETSASWRQDINPCPQTGRHWPTFIRKALCLFGQPQFPSILTFYLTGL